MVTRTNRNNGLIPLRLYPALKGGVFYWFKKSPLRSGARGVRKESEGFFYHFFVAEGFKIVGNSLFSLSDDFFGREVG